MNTYGQGRGKCNVDYAISPKLATKTYKLLPQINTMLNAYVFYIDTKFQNYFFLKILDS